jgi:hypothetical protein
VSLAYGGGVNIDEVQPAHCYARAQRVLSQLQLVTSEMGRIADARTLPEISGAQPRECYFAALSLWHKTERLASEVGVAVIRSLPRAPAVRDTKPGHVLQLIDGVLSQLEEVAQHLHVEEKTKEPAIEASRTPSDVLGLLIAANRGVSRVLERPFTPSDVFRAVGLASTYATALGGRLVAAPFERGRKPGDCYVQLERCLTLATGLLAKQDVAHLTIKGTPSDVLPGDCYDLAMLVAGELAALHAGSASAIQPFEIGNCTQRLPAHVHQLARILEAQLVVL